VRIEATPGGVDVEPLDDETGPIVWKLLGGEFDLGWFTAWAAEQEEPLPELVGAQEGLRPPVAPEPFETLVTSITAQQVSLFAAFAIRNRLIERFGVEARHAYAFPTAERIARASEEELVELGFSRRKAEYVVGLARAEPDYEELARLDDDSVKARLVSIRGLGEWTADWFLARHLARPNAWPAGDLGVRKAVSAFYGDGRDLTTPEVRELSKRFHPFENLAAHYLLGMLYGTAAG
jgi:DNA-3-methyladenine glycosylase II